VVETPSFFGVVSVCAGDWRLYFLARIAMREKLRGRSYIFGCPIEKRYSPCPGFLRGSLVIAE
jgi:hypothetical protein